MRKRKRKWCASGTRVSRLRSLRNFPHPCAVSNANCNVLFIGVHGCQSVSARAVLSVAITRAHAHIRTPLSKSGNTTHTHTHTHAHTHTHTPLSTKTHCFLPSPSHACHRRSHTHTRTHTHVHNTHTHTHTHTHLTPPPPQHYFQEQLNMALRFMFSVSSLSCSLSHHQARTLHPRHDAADVQDPRAERAHPRLQPERPLPGRRQVQRHAGHDAGTAARRMLSLHLPLQGAFVLG